MSIWMLRVVREGETALELLHPRADRDEQVGRFVDLARERRAIEPHQAAEEWMGLGDRPATGRGGLDGIRTVRKIADRAAAPERIVRRR